MIDRKNDNSQQGPRSNGKDECPPPLPKGVPHTLAKVSITLAINLCIE